MDASQLKKLSESYATIAEGGKHEKSAMDWNKKDDNPEGKKVDKKKVDKCTCESFYLKRLKAMNPVMAEKYLAIAEIFIEEGYESSRLIDNLVEALPKEVVGEDFRAALHAVNPKIYENLHTAEKRQARSIVSEQIRLKSPDEWKAGIKKAVERIGNFLNPPRSTSADPVIQKGGKYTGPAGTAAFPSKSKPAPASPGPTEAQKKQKLQQQQAETQKAMKNDPRMTSSSSSSPAPSRPSSPAPKTSTTKPTGPITSRAAIAAGSKEGSGPKSAASTYMAHGDKTKVGRYKTLAQHRAAVAANKAKTVSSSYEPEGELVDENLQNMVDTATKKAQGALERMGVKINRTPKNTARPSAQTKETMRQNKMSNEEVEVSEGSMKQARKNVGASTCWDGYKAKGTKKKNGREVPNCVKEEEITEKKKGLWDNIHAKRKRGEKPAKPGDKDYPKTLDIEEGAMSKDKEDHDTGGFRISDKEAAAARERIKKKTEEKRKKMNIRGNDSDEQKKRLEKKRGMKLDDHPQFKKEDYNLYDIILTYLDENNLMESVEEAEEIMMQLTGAQIVEIIDEFMNMDESMASANRMKELEKERLSNPAPSVKYPAKTTSSSAPRSREFEKRLPKPENRRARSREFEHGSTRSPNTPSANLADKSPRNKDGSLMY